MAAQVTHLWRHPIKGHGSERLSSCHFIQGRTMPWDRVWAIALESAKVAPGDDNWAPCANFSRAAKSPLLAAIRAEVDESSGKIRLHHPDAGSILVNPDIPEDAERIIAWVTPLSNPDRSQPQLVTKATDRGMTDTDFPSVSVLNHASLAELSQKAGKALAMERFRGNIWIDGLEPWQEFDLVGQDISIGDVRLGIRQRTTRCKATTVEPTTGIPDIDTLRILDSNWGHKDFGVYAEVLVSGTISVGDILRHS